MRSERRRKLRIFRLLSFLFSLLSLMSLALFSKAIFKANILPMKYLVIIYIIFFIVFGLLFFAFFKKKCPKPLKIFSYVISVILSIILIVGSIYINDTSDFFDDLQIGDYDTITYSVITLKNSPYTKIDELANKTISYLDDQNKKEVKKALEKRVDYQEQIDTNSTNMASQLLNQKVDALCLEQGYIALLSEEIKDFESNIKTIYTFDIKVKSHKEDDQKLDVTKKPFIVYISGIDQYGNVTSVRGRSDVNQLAIVNPTTHHILLLNTPRDYYVQLAGTTGLKDKLTHAGIYGVEKSIQTLENLYDIDINYYFRVNFNSLIQLVDTIGGIDIYSDTSFNAWTDRSVNIQKGYNHLNGKQALAFARERHAYASGDRHRGENQQQVMKAIINKVTKSQVIISKYSSILNSMSGSFQTDMPSHTITTFIKKQIDEMTGWKIDTFGVTGSGSKQPTYSMGLKYNLYVMIPDQTSIAEAKQKIATILQEG